MSLLPRLAVIGILGFAATPVVGAESLGRLFLTPEQRIALDKLRESGSDAVSTDAAGLALPAGAPADPRVVLNGVVSRNRGPDVVWVNGSRVDRSHGRVQLRRGPDESNRVTLEDATDGATARLKPGQFWDPATGQVADCYGCGAPAVPAELVSAPVSVSLPAPVPVAATSSTVTTAPTASAEDTAAKP